MRRTAGTLAWLLLALAALPLSLVAALLLAPLLVASVLTARGRNDLALATRDAGTAAGHLLR